MKKTIILISTIVLLSSTLANTISALNVHEEEQSLNVTTNTQLLLNQNEYTYDDLEKMLNSMDLPTEIKLPRFVENELIVKFKEEAAIHLSLSPEGYLTTGQESIDELNIEYGVTSAEKIFKQNTDPLLSNIYKFNLSDDADIFNISSFYENNPCVEYAEPNYILCFLGSSDNEENGYQ